MASIYQICDRDLAQPLRVLMRQTCWILRFYAIGSDLFSQLPACRSQTRCLRIRVMTYTFFKQKFDYGLNEVLKVGLALIWWLVSKAFHKTCCAFWQKSHIQLTLKIQTWCTNLLHTTYWFFAIIIFHGPNSLSKIMGGQCLLFQRLHFFKQGNTYSTIIMALCIAIAITDLNRDTLVMCTLNWRFAWIGVTFSWGNLITYIIR